MAERNFNYDNVKTIYEEMNKISDNIEDILTKIDEEYRNRVGVSDTTYSAIYGALGDQLLLDWDNTSSNFDDFIQNFTNWSALIAQSSSNYAEFEDAFSGFSDKIDEFKSTHPLGVTGGTTNYIEQSDYMKYYDENIDSFNDSLNSMLPIYDLTGAEYTDTETKKNLGVSVAWRAVDEVASFASLIGGIKGLKSGIDGFRSLSSIRNATNAVVSTDSTVNAVWSASSKSTSQSAALRAYKAAGGALDSSDDIVKAVTDYVKNGSTGDDAIEAFITKYAKTMSGTDVSYEQASQMLKQWFDGGQTLGKVTQTAYNSGSVPRSIDVTATGATTSSSTSSIVSSSSSASSGSLGDKFARLIISQEELDQALIDGASPFEYLKTMSFAEVANRTFSALFS